MSSHPLHDRSHFSGPASAGSARRSPTASSNRQPSYSSLNEALGGDRPADHPYPQHYQAPEPVPTQMSSEGRYMYPHPQPMTSYEYPPYATSSYDPQQFPQNPARPSRTTPAQTHSPPQQQPPYNPTSPPYHPGYNSAPYPVPQSTPQWNGEAWSQYGQQQYVPTPVQEAPTASGPGRSEIAPAQGGQRTYATPQPASELHRSQETPVSADSASQAKRKQREKETPIRQASPPPVPSIDFRKVRPISVLPAPRCSTRNSYRRFIVS